MFKKTLPQRIGQHLRQYAVTYVLLIAASVFILLPLIYMVSTSFKTISEILTAKTATLIRSEGMEEKSIAVGEKSFPNRRKASETVFARKKIQEKEMRAKVTAVWMKPRTAGSLSSLVTAASLSFAGFTNRETQM